MPSPMDDRPLVQIASYNTALQGLHGVPQDLVDWLSPTLEVSNFLAREPRAPDIVAVGFQELLPLHLGLAGLSRTVTESRSALILSQIEAHAPNKESYSLVARIVNVGVALLVYAKDDGIARHVRNVETSWTGCGPLYMGNKGAVGVRFRVAPDPDSPGEVYTFVCAHLTAHESKVLYRVADYHYIVSSLLFPPLPGSASKAKTTMYTTSHLFFLGDLNFRMSLPDSHPYAGKANRADLNAALSTEEGRSDLREFDQLLDQRKKGTCFTALREGDFWRFKCSYKCIMGEVDRYKCVALLPIFVYLPGLSMRYTPDQSAVTNVLYTSIPSYTFSDHKPIVSLLLLPAPQPRPIIPLLQLPPGFHPRPDPLATLKRYAGRTLDRIVGFCWWFLVVIGAGSAAFGVGNFCLGSARGRGGAGGLRPHMRAEPCVICLSLCGGLDV
ncbi:hypothetical protein EWM64_g9827 [Hericium alpestre]|uniref:Inositol polyphosphate-related phosphatase domain-containing protein n=1 Tax=Hericium alpestre TaxID=135208 RepID=A0A4Y9ZIB3_9AGAM|nr:hypothetical protein EWM64_g9827 [Hericium alpestre]